jgi:hypothetical protein
MHTGTTYRLSCDSHTEPACVLLTVTDDAGRAVGTARLAIGDTWQLAALDAAHPTVAAALCHGVVQTLRVNQVRRFAVTAVDGPDHLACVGLFPTGRSVADLLDRQRRTNPEGYRLVTQGQGLDDVALPYPAELLTAPVGAPALAG